VGVSISSSSCSPFSCSYRCDRSRWSPAPGRRASTRCSAESSRPQRDAPTCSPREDPRPPDAGARLPADAGPRGRPRPGAGAAAAGPRAGAVAAERPRPRPRVGAAAAGLRGTRGQRTVAAGAGPRGRRVDAGRRVGAGAAPRVDVARRRGPVGNFACWQEPLLEQMSLRADSTN